MEYVRRTAGYVRHNIIIFIILNGLRAERRILDLNVGRLGTRERRSDGPDQRPTSVRQ